MAKILKSQSSFKMKWMKISQHRYMQLVLILFFCLSILSIIFIDTKKNLTIPSARSGIKEKQISTFTSTQMKLQILIANEYQVIEDRNSITLHKSEGDIFIKLQSTNIGDIETFVRHLKENQETPLQQEERFSIDSLPAVKGIIGEKKYVFIFTGENIIYSFETSAKELFNELESIAKSTRLIY